MEQTFHLNPITDEEVEQLGLSQSDLWMVQIDDGEVHGPYSTDMLREDSKEHEHLYENCMVYNIVSEQWKSFYTITEFQRRKPKLVPAQSLVKSETFWVLHNGQKSGPLSLAELKEKVAVKEIVLNQEVSIDEGKTWIKIYEHHAFDRRLRQNQEELPFQPDAQVFTNSDGETYSKVVSLQQKKEDQSAISGLAFIGRGNDKGQMMAKSGEEKVAVKQPEATVTPFPTMNKPQKRFGWKKIAIGFTAAVVVSAGFNSFNSNFSEDEVHLGETYRGDVRRINNSDRSTKVRKPASVDKKKRAPRVERAKRYEPPKPRPRPSQERVRGRKQFRESERISHSYEDFEQMDIDDPRVREELSRDLAGEVLDQEMANDRIDQVDEHGEYMDNPEYEPGYSEADPQEMEPEYDDPEAQAIDEPRYEEISDFE